MAVTFKKNTRVQWRWMGRVIAGKVTEIHTSAVVKVIKGKRIKRNGSAKVPAYLVVSDAGNTALKLASELQPYEAKESAWNDEE